MERPSNTCGACVWSGLAGGPGEAPAASGCSGGGGLGWRPGDGGVVHHSLGDRVAVRRWSCGRQGSTPGWWPLLGIEVDEYHALEAVEVLFVPGIVSGPGRGGLPVCGGGVGGGRRVGCRGVVLAQRDRDQRDGEHQGDAQQRCREGGYREVVRWSECPGITRFYSSWGDELGVLDCISRTLCSTPKPEILYHVTGRENFQSTF